MKNRITINEMMAAAKKLKQKGDAFTLLGVGPMSKTLIEAVLELGRDRDFPIMLIASRNQIDSDEFGGGYVCGWDQDRFVTDIHALKASLKFDGLLYLCRDHGGPWQRDEERSAKLPVEKAMDIAKRSYIHDMESGFDLLHIDPTKDPHISGTVPLSLVLDRTVELIEYLENYRKANGLPVVGYEVGTEETNGGLTSDAAFEDFIQKLLARLTEKNLPHPAFIVGQTGTLTRLTENVGHFDSGYAAQLSSIADRHGVGIKEHNADYLRDGILLEHPWLNVTASNVAPEFGVFETRAYLELAFLEAKEIEPSKCSSLYRAISTEAVKGGRWRKWVVGDTVNATVEDVLKDGKLCEMIANIGGHYTFETGAVKQQMAVMNENLAAIGVDGHRYAVRKIKDSIDRYVFCLKLEGLTTKLLNA